MPLLSRYTPCGMLTLSSRPSHAETIFGSMKRSQGEAYGSDGPQDAKLYAQAMGLARGQYQLERAGNQQFPDRSWDLFPVLEKVHGVVPRPQETLAARRAELAARMLLPGGASQTNIENALAALLGSDFVAYRPTPIASAANYPANLGDQPMNLQLPTVPRKRIKILDSVSVGLGSPQTVRYEDAIAGKAPTVFTAPIAVGDVLVVDAAVNSLTERVTVTAIGTQPAGINTVVATLTCVFNKPHGANAIATTATFPFWSSTRRHSLILLTDAAAADAEKRRKVHELMKRIARGVSTWAIAGSTGGASGPFRVGVGRIGITTIGLVTA